MAGKRVDQQLAIARAPEGVAPEPFGRRLVPGRPAYLAEVAGDPNGWWQTVFLMGPALTIGGGTSVVQRNIISERVLGLPRDAEG